MYTVYTVKHYAEYSGRYNSNYLSRNLYVVDISTLVKKMEDNKGLTLVYWWQHKFFMTKRIHYICGYSYFFLHLGQWTFIIKAILVPIRKHTKDEI